MISWLKSLFNRPSTSLPWNKGTANGWSDGRVQYSKNMSVDELRRALNNIIQKQLSDAEDKMSRPGHWGPVGSLVSSAAYGCKHLVDEFLEEHINESNSAFVASLDELKKQLMLARRQYDAVYNDEDGFGGATYMEVIRDIHQMQEAFGYMPSHTVAELREQVFGS